MENIIIFGASSAGKGSYFYLKNYYNIKYFCDNNQAIVGNKINGIEIISPNKLKTLEYDKIVIASQYSEEILHQILKMELDKPVLVLDFELTDTTLLDFGDSEKVNAYLSGEKFHNELRVQYNGIKINYNSRIDIIKDIIKDTNVIHLGCADHLNLIDNKIKTNTWLHGIITKEASRCIGIDNNKEAVNYLFSIGYKNVTYGDILKDSISEILDDHWDYLLIPEVLEHINNPVDFLFGIRRKYTNFDKLLLTVPNALSEINFKYAKRNIETINTDHKYWFTPYTISKILFEAGYNVEKLVACGLPKKKCEYCQPLMMPNIVVVAEKR